MRLSEEQREAAAIGENLIVNAGAGSGKTTVLISRYIRLLEEGGLSPGQIVAITFTRKAAREMRERIDETLAALSMSDPRWEDVREQLVSAPIGTIHSFYAQVLRAFPVEAGINPGFRVLDELESGLLLDKAITAAFQQAVAENCPHLALLTEILGAQAVEEEGKFSRQIRHIYTTLLNRGISVAEAKLSQLYEDLPSVEQCKESLLALTAGEAELAAALQGKDNREMTRVRQAIITAAHDVAGAAAEELVNLYPSLLAMTELKGGRVKGHKEFVAGCVEAVQGLLSKGLAPLLGRAVLALLTRVDETFRQMKARAGGLDFSDLQFAMWRLLEHPQVLAELDKKYLTYMIDEFQDTDRIQHKIIMKLVRRGEAIPPGRLFVVGDEKQSIYRFRGADVEVFNEVRSQLTASSPQAEKQITCNFRSRRPLIDLVNALFSRLLAGEATQYTPLRAYRQGEAPCAEILLCPEQKDVAAAEAAAMAARIREMVAGKELLVGDDSLLPVRYRDIAILIRSRTHIKEYEHHLRLAGIPYTVVGGIGFFEQQEVQDILNLLRAVRNCRDEISLVAALRSPLFALDDDSIFALACSRERGGSLLEQEAVLEGEQRERLQRAREVIAQLAAAEGRLELPEYLELALDLTRYREAVLTGYGGLQRYANLERLVDLAASFAADSSEEDFLTWVEFAASQDEAEAQVDSEESDSVRVMTIHASKGLQFPVVFLPVATAGFRLRTGPMLLDNEGGLAFRYPWQCPVWEEVKEQERLRELREYKRLLYVAMTRARDRLVFVTKEADKAEESFNYWLREFASLAPEHFICKEAGSGEGSLELPLALPQIGCPSPCPGEFVEALAPVGSSASTIRYFSISQFLLWQRDREEFQRRYISRWVYADPREISLQEDWQHEPGGASFGSLLHRALEITDASSSLEAVLKDLVPVYFPCGDKEQQDRVYYSARTLLEGYVRDPGPQGDFFKSAREQEFYYRLGNVLFYGIIDRLLFASDHVAIVDYKTNRIPAEGIGPLVEAYESQLRFYALVTREIYKQPVRAYLQLLRLPPGRQTVEIALSPEKEAELLAQLREFTACLQA